MSESEYLPREELAEIIGCSPSLINLWWKAGEIERIDHPNPVWRGPRHLYHREQTLARGRSRRKLVRMTSRVIDGVQHFRCTRCEKHKPRSAFYKDKRNRGFGVQTRCRDCFHKYHVENYDASAPKFIKKREQAAAIAKGYTVSAREASAWREGVEIDAIIVGYFIKRAYPHENWEQLSRRSGEFSPRRIRAIVLAHKRNEHKRYDGARIKLDTAEHLMGSLGLDDDMDAILRGLSRSRPQWHPKYEYCQRCFRTTVRHLARGLCGTCYDHRHDPSYEPPPESRWSLTVAQCVVCKSTKHKHQAFGKCTSCYRKEWRASRRR